MKDELTQQQMDAILKVLDDALGAGPWEESNFLRVIGKNLAEVRDNFVNQVNEIAPSLEKDSTAGRLLKPDEGQQEIFISLYSTEGNNIQAWERILANLPRQMISRPIYSSEEDVQNLIKSKEKKINEAYVAVYINRYDILQAPAGRISVDKFDRPLIHLKDRTLNLDQVSRFVHLSGVHRYVKGRLVKE